MSKSKKSPEEIMENLLVECVFDDLLTEKDEKEAMKKMLLAFVLLTQDNKNNSPALKELIDYTITGLDPFTKRFKDHCISFIMGEFLARGRDKDNKFKLFMSESLVKKIIFKKGDEPYQYN
ncbi:MAG: hypothetical protein A2033_15975 [Bacteroidetes bacterium GWA2_31_9]|nr:MAG: hypothetical protein A2033_15975 [Bacteroidetes bacterium GWA2_31_9]